MGYTYTGDALMGASLTVTTPKPLDARLVVNTINDLYTIPKETAYKGMTVANIQDGNMYMLIDKEKIDLKVGWKASYESLLIIACSLTEYDEWNKNTNPDFSPIDPGKPYIYSNTYYYTYDLKPNDTITDDLHYMSSKWGKEILEQLSTKASNSAFNLLSEDLKNNYYTSEYINTNYVPLGHINLEDSNSFLSKTLKLYYNKVEADDIFIKRVELLGDSEGGQNFIFVTKKDYDSDKQKLREELDKTLKVDGQGQLESITTSLIKSPSVTATTPNNPEQTTTKQLIVEVKPEGLFINNDPLAKLSEVPEIITIHRLDYNNLETKDPNVYYFIDDDDDSYITKTFLENNYHTKNQYQSWCYSLFYTKTDKNVVVQKDLESYVLNTTLEANYSTKAASDLIYATKTDLNAYVTKEALQGGEGNSEDFVFVTKKKYDLDLGVILNVLDTTLKTNSDGTLDSITVNLLKSKTTSEGQLLIVDVTKDGLIINNDPIVTKSLLPKLTTLTKEEYTVLEESLKVDTDTYYYIYDDKDPDQVYITRSYLKENYDTRTIYQNWCNNLFYTKEATLNLITTTLEPYVKNTTITSIILWQENAETVYATKTDLTTNYVTKTMLLGSESMGDSDFIFVKKSIYDSDRLSDSENFTTTTLTFKHNNLSNNLKLSDENTLIFGNQLIALITDIPKIICLSLTDYESLVDSGTIDIDTYYYTYNPDGLKDNGYVTNTVIESTYCKKSEVNNEIALLKQRVTELENKLQTLMPKG